MPTSIAYDSFGLKAEIVRDPPVTGRLHHHQEIELNYLFSGSVTYLHHWRRRTLPTRRLVAFWGSAPHTLREVTPGSEMAWITVPLSWLLQWNLPARFLRRLLDGEWAEEAGAGESDRHPVRAWALEIQGDSPAAHAAVAFELHAALLRLATSGRARAPAGARLQNTAPGAGGQHVERMARYMAENFADEIAVPDIARSAGLHPKYAMTLFRRRCGITLHDYLQQHRVTHAQRLLITTDAKIIDIALASGFASLSAFYEAFQRIARTTPAEFKRQGRNAG
jgi:AraC family transcriptional regulator, melibiose operon regulatory protein